MNKRAGVWFKREGVDATVLINELTKEQANIIVSGLAKAFGGSSSTDKYGYHEVELPCGSEQVLFRAFQG